VFAPDVYHSADAWVVNLSSPDSPRQWFQDRETMNVLDPSDGEPLNDGELTRAHDKIAVVRGPSTTESSAPTMVRVYAMSNLTDRPVERCDLGSAPNTRSVRRGRLPGESEAAGQGRLAARLRARERAQAQAQALEPLEVEGGDLPVSTLLAQPDSCGAPLELDGGD
jgi:hypothetical protein